jgi:hypothetical protein
VTSGTRGRHINRDNPRAEWAGQFQQMLRADRPLRTVAPAQLTGMQGRTGIPRGESLFPFHPAGNSGTKTDGEIRDSEFEIGFSREADSTNCTRNRQYTHTVLLCQSSMFMERPHGHLRNVNLDSLVNPTPRQIHLQHGKVIRIIDAQLDGMGTSVKDRLTKCNQQRSAS